jgi:hypothetical protein
LFFLKNYILYYFFIHIEHQDPPLFEVGSLVRVKARTTIGELSRLSQEIEMAEVVQYIRRDSKGRLQVKVRPLGVEGKYCKTVLAVDLIPTCMDGQSELRMRGCRGSTSNESNVIKKLKSALEWEILSKQEVENHLAGVPLLLESAVEQAAAIADKRVAKIQNGFEKHISKSDASYTLRSENDRKQQDKKRKRMDKKAVVLTDNFKKRLTKSVEAKNSLQQKVEEEVVKNKVRLEKERQKVKESQKKEQHANNFVDSLFRGDIRDAHLTKKGREAVKSLEEHSSLARELKHAKRSVESETKKKFIAESKTDQMNMKMLNTKRLKNEANSRARKAEKSTVNLTKRNKVHKENKVELINEVCRLSNSCLYLLTF